MNYLVTYEDALEMTKVYKDFNFSKTEFLLNGYKVVTFTYFLCDYNHFTKPLSRKPEVNGLDMRGVTFVFNKDGSLYKRFLMLKKFFNLNQVETTQYSVVKDKKIKSVTIKEDGSLIAFINLPDGTVFAKTIGSFDNEQTNAAMKIYEDDKELRYFVEISLKSGFTPLFEYVAFDNRIVLKYKGRELRFIGFRDNLDGGYSSASSIDKEYEKAKIPREQLMKWGEIRSEGYERLDVPYVKSAGNYTLDELIELSKTEEDVEGWVVQFEDGQMIKIKTEWYFNLHGIRTMNIFREDYVIKNYLEEKLDDIISQLDEKEDEDAFKFVDRVKLAVDNYLKRIDKEVKELIEIYENEYNSDWHYFAKFNNKWAFFGLSVSAIQRPEIYNKKKIEFIINKTKHLKKAQFFVDKWAGESDESISKWRK